MSKDFEKRLDELEAQSHVQRADELQRQFELRTPAQVGHDVAVFASILERLSPTEPECWAWLAGYRESQGGVL